MRWTGRRARDADEELWVGTTVGDPLPGDEASVGPPQPPCSAVRAFVRRFLTPRWAVTETPTEKTWGSELEDMVGSAGPMGGPALGGPRAHTRTSVDDYKGEFSWVVVDSDLRLGGKAQPEDDGAADAEGAEGADTDAEPDAASEKGAGLITSQQPRPGGSGPGSRPPSAPPSVSVSVARGTAGSALCLGRRVLVDSVWPFVRSFAYMSFPDPAQERSFQHETSKAGACAGAFFLGLSTVLSIAFTQKWTSWNYYSYVGVAGTLNLSLPVMIACNTYVRSPWVYQVLLLCATWCWPFILAFEIRNCGFFGAVDECGGRNFLNFFALLAGIPTFALMTLLQNRALHLVGITSWAVGMVGLFLGQPKANLPMWRNVILASVFHHIFVWAAFFRERADRQLFTLRSQLKAQYRAVQAAQEMERRALASKRQFFSYIFHEVRVPLNTARLALANLHAEGAFHALHAEQRDLIVGLDASMRLMEKVLNDVLSFNRLEDGRLAFSHAPFSLHGAVREAARLHRAAADAAGLAFALELDERIDALGALVGDELRVRQLCANLLSNALKFTRAGGVRLVTRLLHSVYTHPRAGAGGGDGPGSAVAVRVEVHDTGAGLALADMRGNRLFSPYVQTEIGRRQGGKGSGLGLALVTQLVRLARGRLGVDSAPGRGSVFWFELPFALSNDAPVRAPAESLPLTFPGPGAPAPAPAEPFPLSVSCRSSYEFLGRDAAAGSPERAHARTHSARSHSHSHSSRSPRSPPRGRPPPPPGNPGTSGGVGHAHAHARLPPRRPPPRARLETGLSTLVVDDDELTRELMMRTLRRLGHNAVLARNGMEALRVLKAGYEGGDPVDIVFLDNQMPAMSGVETVRAIRALQWDVYVVGCTGNALQEDQDEYRDAGADAVVTKPVSIAAIRDKLELVRSRG